MLKTKAKAHSDPQTGRYAHTHTGRYAHTHILGCTPQYPHAQAHKHICTHTHKTKTQRHTYIDMMDRRMDTQRKERERLPARQTSMQTGKQVDRHLSQYEVYKK